MLERAAVLNLSKIGRRDEALAAMRESVEIRRALVATRPDAFRIDLARSLANLADLVEQTDGGDAAGRMREEVAMLKAASTSPTA